MKQRFIDPATLAKIAPLGLLARTVVEGFLAGIHSSPFHGYSAEFTEYRPYNAGDDTRYIDWRVYARTDRYFIKRFEEETNLNCYFLIDSSASMGYKPSAISKLDYALMLAASLAFLITRQRDRIALASITDRFTYALPPGGTERHLQAFLRELESINAIGTSNLKQALRGAGDALRRRGIVIFISDLYDEPDDTAVALARIRRIGHEVIVFHLIDASERMLGFHGPAEFVDLETGERITLDPSRAREQYQSKLEGALSFYKRRLTGEGIDFVSLDTSRPLDLALRAYLMMRAARIR